MGLRATYLNTEFGPFSDLRRYNVIILPDLPRREIEQMRESLRNAGCETDICCYWVSTGQGGPSLEVATMEELARLGLPIWWDVYFDGSARTNRARFTRRDQDSRMPRLLSTRRMEKSTFRSAGLASPRRAATVSFTPAALNEPGGLAPAPCHVGLAL